MGTVHALFNKDDALGVLLRATIDAPPLPEPPHDEFFDVLSGLLEEPARVSADVAPPHEMNNDDAILLREVNSRLRALAIELSNLVGDLPVPR
jgi:hypothetical protein